MEATAGARTLAGQGQARRATRGPWTPSHASRAADWPHTTRLLPWALVGFLAMLWFIPFDSIYLPLGLPVDATLDRPLLVLLVGLWLWAPA